MIDYLLSDSVPINWSAMPNLLNASRTPSYIRLIHQSVMSQQRHLLSSALAGASQKNSHIPINTTHQPGSTTASNHLGGETISTMHLWFAVTGAILLMVVMLFVVNKIIDLRDEKRNRQVRRHHVLSREGSFKRTSVVRTSLTGLQPPPPTDRQPPATHLFMAFFNGTRRGTLASTV